ncbi:MAG: hypothetical protein MK106_07275 [Mariniblastus sp.]|nr:hypothetical protein [Mariniblastus sp.]
MLKNRQFPPWCAPLVGILAGGYVAMKNMVLGNAGLPGYLMILGGMVIGGLAGCSVFLLDPRGRAEPSSLFAEHLVPTPRRSSSLVGRVLAAFGVLLSWFPLLGLVLNLIGYLVNRKTDDWAVWTSKIGLIVGLSVSVGMIFGFVIEWIR